MTAIERGIAALMVATLLYLAGHIAYAIARPATPVAVCEESCR